MLGMHLAAKKLIMLGDLCIDREAVRVTERLSNLSDLIILHLRHIYQTQSSANPFIKKRESKYFDAHLNKQA